MCVWTGGQWHGAEERRWGYPFPFQLLHENNPGFRTEELCLLCHLHSKQQQEWGPSQNLSWGFHSPDLLKCHLCQFIRKHWARSHSGGDMSGGFTQTLWCRMRVCHPTGFYRLRSLQGCICISSPEIHLLLHDPGIKFSWQVDMNSPLPNCIWYV